MATVEKTQVVVEKENTRTLVAALKDNVNVLKEKLNSDNVKTTLKYGAYTSVPIVLGTVAYLYKDVLVNFVLDFKL